MKDRKLSLISNLNLALFLSRLPLRQLDTVRNTLSRALIAATAWLLNPLRHHFFGAFNRRVFKIRGWHTLAAAFLSLQLLRWLYNKLSSGRFGRAHKQAQALRHKLATATTYEEWGEAATSLDTLEGRNLPSWVHTRGVAGLRERASALRQARENNDLPSLCFHLRQDGTRSVGQLMAAAVEESTVLHLTPPPVVDAYVAEVKQALNFIAASSDVPLEERLVFIRELRHSYGRTALVLSGGGTFGFFHFGVIRALFHAGLLPRVISGSSAGAIGAALLCVRSDSELGEYMDAFVQLDLDFFGAPKTLRDFARHLYRQGTLHNVEEYIPRLQRLMGAETTFGEAYAHSGRVLNIAVVAADTREPCRLLNYLTAPNVLVWSAVACSSAFPLLFAPQELLCKDASGRIVPHHASGAAGPSGSLRRWCDGSLEEDLPMRGLSEMFSINFFLVSQANPYLVPVLAIRSLFSPNLRRLGEYELKHRLKQLLSIWPHSRTLKLFSQPWGGDINFVMPANLFQPFKSATNFSKPEIELVMEVGQQSVWAKLEAIRAACAVEYLIDEELQSLSARARRRKVRFNNSSDTNTSTNRTSTLQDRRGRLPSWLDLRSLGLPASDSNDDVASLAGAPERSRGSLDSVRELEQLEGGVAGVSSQEGAEVQKEEEEAARLPERGVEAWRDLTALSLQLEGLAP